MIVNRESVEGVNESVEGVNESVEGGISGVFISNMESYALNELSEAGMFKEDSDYEGDMGKSVMELISLFARQGHSGFSGSMALHLFRRLANFKPLSPIQKPTENEYCERGPGVYQHKRLSSLFSNDFGKHWHDIDVKRTMLDIIFKKRWHRVKFPYLPKIM